jgi:hypothetical protein
MVGPVEIILHHPPGIASYQFLREANQQNPNSLSPMMCDVSDV